MLTILGPAKTIDTSPHGITEKSTFPQYMDQAEMLVNQVRKYSVPQLRSLMKVSDKLATLSFERYAGWRSSYSAEEGQQAILAFSGEVFNGLQARSLSEEDLLFAQKQVRLLSGLYGVLRPLDLILPYRLEMGTKMKNKKVVLFPKYQKIMEQVGENIKLARKRRKLTTIQVSERAGIDRKTLYQIEKGSSKVAVGSYFNVLVVLGLQDDFLKLANDDEFGRKLQDLDLL